MANYVGSARSNYFRVRDEGKFRRWVETLPGVVIDREEDDPDQFVLLVETGDDGGWPTCRFDEEGDCSDLDLFGELAGHLAPGEVAILEEVGAEKLRYLVGYAVAVNSRGEQPRRADRGLDRRHLRAGTRSRLGRTHHLRNLLIILRVRPNPVFGSPDNSYP